MTTYKMHWPAIAIAMLLGVTTAGTIAAAGPLPSANAAASAIATTTADNLEVVHRRWRGRGWYGYGYYSPRIYIAPSYGYGYYPRYYGRPYYSYYDDGYYYDRPYRRTYSRRWVRERFRHPLGRR